MENKPLNALNRLIGLGLLAAIFCLGCGDSEEDVSTDSAPLDGNWLLTITQDYGNGQGDYRDVGTVLLNITQNEGEYQATIKGNKAALPSPKLKTFEVKDDQVHLVINSDIYTYDFEGTIQGDVIRGNVDQGSMVIEPAQLVKKPILNISEAEDFPLPMNHLEYHVLLDKVSDEKSNRIPISDHYADFLAFCEKYPQSPLSAILSHAIVDVMPRKTTTKDEVKSFAESYTKRAAIWGERMQMTAQYKVGRSLIREDQFLDLGLEYLKAAESRMNPEKKAAMQDELAYYRKMAKNFQTRSEAKLAYDRVKQDKSPEGLAKLQTLGEQSPFDPVVMFLQGEAAREMNHPDEALKLYAQLATWPRLQSTLTQEPVWEAGEKKLPEGLFLELWVEQHGNEDGLEEFKTQTYREATQLIAEKIGKPKASPTGNRLHVMELFTGAACRPCVGADLATSALEQLYPPSHLLVLRYHVNSAGVDPLTHPRNIERFQNLIAGNTNGQLATPSVFLDGQPVAARVGGFFDTAPSIGKNLKEELQGKLGQSSPLELNLRGYQHEGEITISAQLSQVPPDQKDKLRVQLLLAEEKIEFAAPNGIRQHEMIVRWFYNDGNGLALSSAGDFQFNAKVRLKDIRGLMSASTQSAAEQFDQEVTTIPLDLDGLHLVALVQNAETREIVQAAQIALKEYDTSPMLPGLQIPGNGPRVGPLLTDPNARKPASPKPKAKTPEDENKKAPGLVLPDLPS